MTKTVTALFHNEQHATSAANRLEQAGIPRDGIDIWSTPHNLAPLLEDEGVSRADAHAYAEGVRRGGSLVIVKCDGEIDEVVSILDQEGVLDLEEQQALWRSEGWQEAAGPAGSLTGSANPAQGGTGEGHDLTGSPDMTRARTDMDTSGRPDEVGPDRVRIQIRKAEHPVQK
ncbi:hypothetical protein [Microvirga vignae]|uniref:hypothetical protein n=1 Tax=Microvirga vignae TaxID=1225564 RepID=UPI000AE5B52C|nr:hypothetical protein [Microvirga vignae]